MSKPTVHVLCDNGQVMLHDLPLPSGVADRVARGQLRLVNADGTPLSETPAEPEAPAAEGEPAAEQVAEQVDETGESAEAPKKTARAKA